MALVSLSLAGSTVTLLPGDPGTVGSGDVLAIAALNNGTLNVQGAEVDITSITGATVGSTATFNVTDGGTLSVGGGLLQLGALSSTTVNIDDGTFNMDAGGLSLAGLNSLLSSTTMNFGAGEGAFNFEPPTLSVLGSYTLNLNGLGAGDQVSVNGATVSGFTADSATSGTLTLVVPGAIPLVTDTTVTLNLTDADPALISALLENPEAVFADGELLVPCLVHGTHVLTPDGDVKVENLSPGHLVMTKRGDVLVPVPVKWIGKRSIDLSRAGDAEKARPVRIAAGALGDSVPRRDLLVSRDHCMLINGELVEAHWLVNDSTITVDTSMAEVTYFHIELPEHGILIAEGAATESYLDTGNRRMFANTTVVGLRPQFEPRATDARNCAPMMRDRDSLLALTAQLVARAESLGWRRSRDPKVHLLVDGLVIRPYSREGRSIRFRLPANATSVRLRSTHGVPRAVKSQNLDGRRLGICIGSVKYSLLGKACIAHHGQVPMGEGFYPSQKKQDFTFAWTTGDADLSNVLAPMKTVGGEIEIELIEIQTSWLAPTEKLSADQQRLTA